MIFALDNIHTQDIVISLSCIILFFAHHYFHFYILIHVIRSFELIILNIKMFFIFKSTPHIHRKELSK